MEAVNKGLGDFVLFFTDFHWPGDEIEGFHVNSHQIDFEARELLSQKSYVPW